jgi:hypothetical protein
MRMIEGLDANAFEFLEFAGTAMSATARGGTGPLKER